MNETQAEKRANVFSLRNFRLVFFGALVSELGATLYSFAVSFYILEISGNNAFLQGLYLALCGGVLLVFTPIGGVLGDRYDKARIMFVCDYMKGGLILLATLFLALFPSQSAHIAILFAVGILGSAVSGVFDPAAGALLPSIVEEDSLQQANAYFSVKSALLGILGVVLAGILYGALPIRLLFMLVGVCFLLSGVSEMFIRYAHTPSGEKLTVRLALSDMGEGLRYLRGQKAVMALVISILFVNFFISPIGSNFIPYFIRTDVALAPSYLLDKLLTPELWTSVFSMLLGLSSLVGSVILSARAQEDKCGHKVAVRLCVMAGLTIALTVSYWLLVAKGISLNAFLLLFCLGCLLLGAILSFINIPISTALMRVVDKDKLSKVTSILSILSQGLVPIASVLAGAVLQVFGSSVLLLACSVGFTAAALFLLVNKQAKEI
jgi:Major Facilitator Superfamily.